MRKPCNCSPKSECTMRSIHSLPLLIGLSLMPVLAQAERADRDQPINLEADRVSIDDKALTRVFEGHVKFTQGTLLLTGSKVVITETPEGLRHGTVTGNLATFRQKRDESDEYVNGRAERIEYDTGSDIVELHDHATIIQGKDEVHGNFIRYNSRDETYTVVGAAAKQPDTRDDGRVHIIIYPKEKKPAPGAADAPAKP